MQKGKAETFARLHRVGDPLLLANAWDVASAVVIEAAGSAAVATTSAGVAWSLGVPDGTDLGGQRVAEVVSRITAAVSVPVSADIEAGYGDSPDAVAATVGAVVQAGAVGVNLEDRRTPTSLYDIGEQADRLAAARAAARDVPLWINARTDVFLAGGGSSAEARITEALQRAAQYEKAGANSLFVPGLIDLGALSQMVAGPLPVAVMVWPGAPTVAELTTIGVVRISLGSAIAQAAYQLTGRAATELLSVGSYDACADGIEYATMNETMRRSARGAALDSVSPWPRAGR
jgi:2-methylisocitrate lyase-like PEP mutase family enzyme